MNKIISPFQMKINKIESFEINQNYPIKEYNDNCVTLGTDYKISNLSTENDIMSAQINLFVQLIGETENEETIFNIELNMMGIFEADGKQIDKDRFNSMLEINGISTLMQLSRAYVTAVTSLSGFTHPINFPMVNVFELIKMKKKDQNKED